MVVFASSVGGYSIYANGREVGFFSHMGDVYRYIGNSTQWMGTMAREDTYRLFNALYM